jgi:hypothetical protein
MNTADAFLRQRDILTPVDLTGQHVDIVGGGSIGGAIAICLAKMGFGIQGRITVTDFDVCEISNLATQWFRQSHVELSQPKVEALAEMVAWVCDLEITTVQARFTGDEPRPLGPIVILAVDTLEERRRIWEQLKPRQDVQLLVDVRMGAEILEIHAVERGHDAVEAYESSIASDVVPYEEPCTRRAVLYTALGAASFVGSILRAYAKREPFPRYLAFDFRNFFVSTCTPAHP